MDGLAVARKRKGWSQEKLAEMLNVGLSTVQRWERGTSMPQAAHAQRLYEVLGIAAQDLGLNADAPPILLPKAVKRLHIAAQKDLTIRLLGLVLQPFTYHWELQHAIAQAIEDYDMQINKNYHINRREALHRLVMLPVAASSLDAIIRGESPAKSVMKDFLTQCAASLTACWELSKSTEPGDLAMAFDGASAYLPALQKIVKDDSQHRQTAASLLAQCYLLKTVLGWHRESLDKAMVYAREAAAYSEVAGDLPLQISVYRQLSWVYYYARQRKKSLEAVEQAAYLLRTSTIPLPPALHSSVHSTRAVRHAMHRQQQQAISAAHLAHEHFFQESALDNKFIYIDCSLPGLILQDGMTHAYLGLHQQALDSFAQIIDLNDCSSKMPVAGRTRVEILNNQVFSLLKTPEWDRDLAIKLWTRGIQEAKTLQSEQRFQEALTAYDIMEALWPSDKTIRELSDLREHW